LEARLSRAIAFAAIGVDIELIAGAIYFVGDGVDLARSAALFDLATFFIACRVVACFEHVANGA
jgi:hypothetical protein